jgi:hypothetical protein
MSELLKIGELYSPKRSSWPERADFNIRNGAPELRLFLNSPSSAEIQAVASGKKTFALFIEDPVIVLCYQFVVPGKPPAIPWSDAPFSMHLVAETLPDEAVPIEMPDLLQERVLLTTLLIDARTGILKVINASTFSTDFTASLALAVKHQMALPWDAEQFDRALQSIYRRYPDARALATAANIRGEGGE